MAQSVRSVLIRQPDYRSGDLLTEGVLDSVWRELARLGWRPGAEARHEITSRLLGEKEFLARELHSTAGRKFMREVNGYPLAYDKLDRLANMPQGHATIKRLIAEPGGYQLIEYLSTTPGGRETSKQLARTPRGRDFTKPTGRIYTEQQLIEALEEAYRAEVR